LKFDDEITTSQRPQTPSRDAQHWRHKLDKTDLLESLRRIKELDNQGRKAIPKYLRALDHKYAPVRYWAVVGLHNNCKSPTDISRAKKALRESLKDPATIVRVAAAHALCDWDQEKEALPVLAQGLKDKTDKARLYAIIALDKIGEKARPVLPQMKIVLKDSDNYVKRVAQTAINQLEGK
jgi:hypothetical protein